MPTSKVELWFLVDGNCLILGMVVQVLISIFIFISFLFIFYWQQANDSRIFGPVPMSDIVGRVIYCLRTAVDHGRVQNR